MRRSEIEVGKKYACKVSGKIVPVRILKDLGYKSTYVGHQAGVGTYAEKHAGWDAVNTATKRPIHVRSAARLRREWADPRCGACANCLVLTAERLMHAERYRTAVESGDQESMLVCRREWAERVKLLPCVKTVGGAA